MLAFRLKRIEYDLESEQEIVAQEYVFIDSEDMSAEDKICEYIDGLPAIKVYIVGAKLYPQFTIEKVTIH